MTLFLARLFTLRALIVAFRNRRAEYLREAYARGLSLSEVLETGEPFTAILASSPTKGLSWRYVPGRCRFRDARPVSDEAWVDQWAADTQAYLDTR